MRSQDLMLKKILTSIGVSALIHIPYVPDMSSLTKISTTSTSNRTHPPTYERLYRNFIPE